MVKCSPVLFLSHFVIFNINLFLLIGGQLLYNIVLVLPYINMNPPWVYTWSPSWTPFPSPFPYHPSGSSQCTSPEHPVSCIKPGLAIRFTYDSIHFNASLPNHLTLALSYRVQKTVLYICVSFAVLHWNMYNIIYEKNRQSRFDAWYWMLGAGALRWPRGMVWGGRRERVSGWGTCVYL